MAEISRDLEKHKRLAMGPKAAIHATVDSHSRVIVDLGVPIELALIREASEDGDNEQWICVPLEARIGRDICDLDLWLRAVATEATEVVLHLGSELFESVRRMHLVGEGLDEAAKFDLVQFFTDTAFAVGARGFGYRSTREDLVPRPPELRTLTNWMNLCRGLEEATMPWLIAGVQAAQLQAGSVPSPYTNQRDGFAIYDLLQPPPVDIGR